MQQKATLGHLQLTHNDLRRLLMGHTINISVENSRKVNFILELNFKRFNNYPDLTEFIQAIGMDEPPELWIE